MLRAATLTVPFLAAMLALSPAAPPTACAGDPYDTARRAMVETQIRARGVTDERVLRAMLTPRHLFVDERYRRQAYDDHPLPIGYGQTISQPCIVALMTQEAAVRLGHRVLEIGTGSRRDLRPRAIPAAQHVLFPEIVEVGGHPGHDAMPLCPTCASTNEGSGTAACRPHRFFGTRRHVQDEEECARRWQWPHRRRLPPSDTH